MYSYLARIELRGPATSSDYDALHNQMKKNGFVSSLVGYDRKICQFPTEEYAAMGYDIDEVYSRAKKAAELTGKQSSVFVVRYDQWMGDVKKEK